MFIRAHIKCFLKKMTSLLWCYVYIEQSQSVQYFVHFTTCQVLNAIASYQYQKNEHGYVI